MKNFKYLVTHFLLNCQQLKHFCLFQKALAILDTIIPDSEYDECNLGFTSQVDMKAWKEKECQDTEDSSRRKAIQRKCRKRRSEPICLGAGKCFESNNTKTDSVCKTCYR